MIEPTRLPAAETTDPTRDERSMRLMEYATAIVALAAAILLSLR